MASFRAQFSETITTPIGVGGAVVPLSGIAATVYVCNSDGSDGPQAPAYADSTSATRATNLVTNSFGNISFYLDAGNYNIHFDDQQSPLRIPPFVKGFTSLTVLSASEISTLNSLVSDITFAEWNTYGLSIPNAESIPSSAYSLMPTPDKIPNVSVTQNRSLVGVWYHAVWQENVGGGCRAAIFVETSQLQVPGPGGPVTQAAGKPTGSITSIDAPLSTFSGGIMTLGSSSTSYANDVSTGQAQAISSSNDAASAPTGLAVTLVLGGPASSFASGLYYWMVTANTAAGETGPSNEALYNYFAPGPRLALSWNPTPGATSYNVYRSTISGGEATSPALVASGVGTNSYVDTGSGVTSGAVPTLFGPRMSYELNGTVYSASTPRNEGGPCWIMFPGVGTYDISIQFKANSGGGIVRNRVLRVASVPFAF